MKRPKLRSSSKEPIDGLLPWSKWPNGMHILRIDDETQGVDYSLFSLFKAFHEIE